MTSTNNYWLARWIDEFAIQDEEDVARRLNTQSSIQKIVDSIVLEIADPLKLPQVQVQDGAAVACRRVDLSGALGCQAYECQRKIIDASFGRILHYFDSIVVEGLSPHRAIYMAQNDSELFRFSVLQHAQTFLYLRKIGAEPFVVFAEKAGLCERHANEEADELHVFSAYDKDEKAKLVGRIRRTSTFNIREVYDGWHVLVDGPLFQEPVTAFVKGSKKPTKINIAEYAAQLYSGALLTDVLSARLFKLPLVEAGSSAWLTKGRQRATVTDTDVALQLDLPILNRLDLASFLKLREDERQSFESFRTALAAAISEQLSSGRTEGQVAAAVVKEFIAPSLTEIERRATSSRRVLIKKSTLDFSVGTAAAVIGLTESIPLVLTVSAAAIAAVLGVVHSHIDTRDSIRLSDCYFLWRAKKLTPQHK